MVRWKMRKDKENLGGRIEIEGGGGSGRARVKAERLISLDTERKWSCLGSIMQLFTSGGGASPRGWMSLSD